MRVRDRLLTSSLAGAALTSQAGPEPVNEVLPGISKRNQMRTCPPKSPSVSRQLWIGFTLNHYLHLTSESLSSTDRNAPATGTVATRVLPSFRNFRTYPCRLRLRRELANRSKRRMWASAARLDRRVAIPAVAVPRPRRPSPTPGLFPKLDDVGRVKCLAS